MMVNFSPGLQEKAYFVLKENLPIYRSLIVDNFSSLNHSKQTINHTLSGCLSLNLHAGIS